MQKKENCHKAAKAQRILLRKMSGVFLSQRGIHQHKPQNIKTTIGETPIEKRTSTIYKPNLQYKIKAAIYILFQEGKHRFRKILILFMRRGFATKFRYNF